MNHLTLMNSKREKIKEKIEQERENRVKLQRKLPVVNTELAKRIIEEKEAQNTKTKSKNKVFLKTKSHLNIQIINNYV